MPVSIGDAPTLPSPRLPADWFKAPPLLQDLVGESSENSSAVFMKRSGAYRSHDHGSERTICAHLLRQNFHPPLFRRNTSDLTFLKICVHVSTAGINENQRAVLDSSQDFS